MKHSRVLMSLPAVLLLGPHICSASRDPEKRITCGGSYSWPQPTWIGGGPCPPPQWEAVWELNKSTTPNTPWGPIVAVGNIPDYYDPVNASRWGWTTFDWSVANAVWQNTHPHNNEAVMVEQCRRVKAQGTGTRCMTYRNLELALQWQETSRAAMTQENAEKGWFLTFKSQEDCDAAPPCDVAAWHNIINQSAPLVPCNKTAPRSEPNCVSCCNFTQHGRVYNEPIGGPWPPNPSSNTTRFGDNALNDGQLFWDFRKTEVQDYWAQEVALGGVTGAADPYVDGLFTDDPNGLGAEHVAVITATGLSKDEVAAVQLGSQQAWIKALALMTKAKKYIPQAYRTTPPFKSDPAGCTQWMRAQCALPANESTQTYPAAPAAGAAGNMSVAAFLVSRGPYSYLSANNDCISGGDWNDPLFRLHRLDTGKPSGDCTEGPSGVFSRDWTGGRAVVDCNAGHSTLDFQLLPQP